MDNFTFIVDMTKALAWPIAATVIAFKFKEPLSALLSQLENMKVQGAEFKFGKAVKEIKVQEETKLLAQPVIEVPTNLIRLSEISPRGALLEAWIEVEDALIDARKRCASRRRADIDYESPIPANTSLNLINNYLRRGIVSAETLDLYRKLRAIRNEVVHSRRLRLSSDDVYDFLELAMRLKLEFENAQPEEPNESLEKDAP